MPKRTGTERPSSAMDCITQKIQRKDSSISTEEDFEDDSDCIILNRIPGRPLVLFIYGRIEKKTSFGIVVGGGQAKPKLTGIFYDC